MPRHRFWSDDELEALAAIGPQDRAALAAFRERFPSHSPGAVRSKLSILRMRQVAADATVGRRDDPMPKYRFS
jgi:hypothetical protein